MKAELFAFLSPALAEARAFSQFLNVKEIDHSECLRNSYAQIFTTAHAP
jgi:hypothetical protein